MEISTIVERQPEDIQMTIKTGLKFIDDFCKVSLANYVGQYHLLHMLVINVVCVIFLGLLFSD